MKAFRVFVKTLREVRRERLILCLTIVFAPLFVIIYYFAFPDSITTQTLAVVNTDQGAALPTGERIRAGDDLVAVIGARRTAEGKPLVTVTRVSSKAAGARLLRARDASALLVLPPDLSSALVASRVTTPANQAPASTSLTVTGDLSNPSYVVTAVLTRDAIEGYLREFTGREDPLTFVEEPLGGSAVRDDFDVYVTGLFVFSIIMLVFLTSMTVARETETGAMRRLRLTRMTAVDYLAGTSGVLLLIAIACVAVTFATAAALGFHSGGSLWVGGLIAVVTALAVIGAGLITGVLAKTVSRAFVMANFPFGLLAFLSGAVFPLPQSTLFTIFGHPVGAFDLLPTTHAVTGLNKVFTAGTGLRDIGYELTALVTLTIGYFGAGALLLAIRTGHAARRQGTSSRP